MFVQKLNSCKLCRAEPLYTDCPGIPRSSVTRASERAPLIHHVTAHERRALTRMRSCQSCVYSIGSVGLSAASFLFIFLHGYIARLSPSPQVFAFCRIEAGLVHGVSSLSKLAKSAVLGGFIRLGRDDDGDFTRPPVRASGEN